MFPFYFLAGWLHIVLVHAQVVVGIHTLIEQFRDRSKNHCSSILPWLGILVASTGAVILFAYLMEIFIAFYGGNIYEVDAFTYRWGAGSAWVSWLHLAINACSQFFWIPHIRRTALSTTVIAITLMIPSFFEIFVELMPLFS